MNCCYVNNADTYTAQATITPTNPATTPMTTTVVSLELLLCAEACAPKIERFLLSVTCAFVSVCDP